MPKARGNGERDVGARAQVPQDVVQVQPAAVIEWPRLAAGDDQHAQQPYGVAHDTLSSTGSVTVCDFTRVGSQRRTAASTRASEMSSMQLGEKSHVRR